MSTDKKSIEIRLWTGKNLYVARIVEVRIGETDYTKYVEEFKKDWPLSAASPNLRVEILDYRG